MKPNTNKNYKNISEKKEIRRRIATNMCSKKDINNVLYERGGQGSEYQESG